MYFGRFGLFVSVIACCFGLLVSSTPSRAQIASASTPLLATGCLVNCHIAGAVTSISSPTQFVYHTWWSHRNVTVINPAGVVGPRGSTLRVGQIVMVGGSFNGAGNLVATSVSVFTFDHIATVASDDYTGEGAYATAAQVNQLATYTETAGKGLRDCHSVLLGCKAIFYMRPFALRDNRVTSCIMHPDADIVSAAKESWFVHDAGHSDASHRIYGYDRWGCKLWGMNPNAGGLQASWSNYLESSANQYDLYFVDMSPMDVRNATWFYSGGGCTPWPHVCLTTQELPTDTAVTNAHINFVDAMYHTNGNPMRFLYQQAYPRYTLPLDVGAIQTTNRYFGVTCEGCLADIPPAPPVSPQNYAPFLDEMAAVNRTGGEFVVLSKGTYPSGSANQILQRLVTTGVVWLAYSEGHTIVQPDLERNTHGLAIWPEDMIYPNDAIESMVNGSADLEVAPGVYRREFNTCYRNGQSFGACATVVNANTSAVTIRASWLGLRYHHVIVLTGGDVLSGGIANLAGRPFVPGSTVVPAGGATLLAP